MARRKKEKTIYVGGQVPIDVHDFLSEFAVQNDKSLSAIVRAALCEYASKIRKLSKEET